MSSFATRWKPPAPSNVTAWMTWTMPVKVTVSPLQGLNTAPLIGIWTFCVTEAAALTATNSRVANRYGTSIFTLFIFPSFFWIRFLDQFRGRNILGSRRGDRALDALNVGIFARKSISVAPSCQGGKATRVGST